MESANGLWVVDLQSSLAHAVDSFPSGSFQPTCQQKCAMDPSFLCLGDSEVLAHSCARCPRAGWPGKAKDASSRPVGTPIATKEGYGDPHKGPYWSIVAIDAAERMADHTHLTGLL